MVKVELARLNVAPVSVVKSTPEFMMKLQLPPVMVRVPAPLKENVPVVVKVAAALKSIVPVKAPPVNEPTVLVPLMVAARVTVPPPEAPSNVTPSTAAGTEAPPAPPVAADQCVVVTLSHVPVPPTQKRLAISQRLTCSTM
jgi:hypothetical protein